MSLILVAHNEVFGVICSDGRVSTQLPDGKRTSLAGRIGTKFAVLRPNLVLAGSSSLTASFDRLVFDATQQYVAGNPGASFDEVVAQLRRLLPEIEKQLGIRGKHFFGAALVGFDKNFGRVRACSFSFSDGECELSEHPSGVMATGFIESEERIPHRLLARINEQSSEEERTPATVIQAMFILAEEIAATRREVVGAPYSFYVIRAECE